MRIERASANDMLQRATDVGPAPMQVGAVLVLGADLDLDAVREVVDRRSRAVARLRQRLVPTPPGCGRPIWVVDDDFAIDRHVRDRACPGEGGEDDLLAVAADLLTRRLPDDRPPWSTTLVTGLAGGRSALVIVFDHVLADGIGGLAVLATLVDGVPVSPIGLSGPRWPGWWRLLVDATRTRLAALRRLPVAARRMRDAVAELRQGGPGRVARSSMNRPTGPARTFHMARAPLAPVVDLAHAHGATVNDVVLTAVGGALASTLRDRGEEPPEAFVVSVPVSARRSADPDQLGNEVGVMPVAVPTSADRVARLEATAAAHRERRDVPRGASTALLGPAFRLLAAVGAFRAFVERQRLVTTFATNLRGPEEPLRFLGAPVEEVLPLSTLAGNVTVAFAVLSYAGTLAVTVITDPDACPDHARVTDHFQAELDALVSLTPSAPGL